MLLLSSLPQLLHEDCVFGIAATDDLVFSVDPWHSFGLAASLHAALAPAVLLAAALLYTYGGAPEAANAGTGGPARWDVVASFLDALRHCCARADAGAAAVAAGAASANADDAAGPPPFPLGAVLLAGVACALVARPLAVSLALRRLPAGTFYGLRTGAACGAGVLSLLVDDRLFAHLGPHERFWGRVAPLLVLALSGVTSWQGLKKTVYHNSSQALRRARMKVEHLLQETHTAKVERQIADQQRRIERGTKAADASQQWFFGGGAEHAQQHGHAAVTVQLGPEERFALKRELGRLKALHSHRLDFEYMDRALGTLHDRGADDLCFSLLLDAAVGSGISMKKAEMDAATAAMKRHMGGYDAGIGQGAPGHGGGGGGGGGGDEGADEKAGNKGSMELGHGPVVGCGTSDRWMAYMVDEVDTILDPGGRTKSTVVVEGVRRRKKVVERQKQRLLNRSWVGTNGITRDVAKNLVGMDLMRTVEGEQGTLRLMLDEEEEISSDTASDDSEGDIGVNEAEADQIREKLMKLEGTLSKVVSIFR